MNYISKDHQTFKENLYYEKSNRQEEIDNLEERDAFNIRRKPDLETHCFQEGNTTSMKQEERLFKITTENEKVLLESKNMIMAEMIS